MRVTNKNKETICDDLRNLYTLLSRSKGCPNCSEVQEMVQHVINYADSFKSVIWNL